MEQVKSALLSKTIWGAIVAVIGGVLSAGKFDITGLTGIDGEIVTFLGSAFAVYGRIVAVKKLK